MRSSIGLLRRLSRRLPGVSFGVILASLLVTPTVANHGTPHPYSDLFYLAPWRTFWDRNSDLVADTYPDRPKIDFYARGSGWTSLAYQRLDDAANTWDGQSHFDIDTFIWGSGDPTTRSVWLGYADSPCPVTDIAPAAIKSDPDPVYVGGQLRHWRMMDSCISFNREDYSFNFGTERRDGYLLFVGVLTHEFGHAASLGEGQSHDYSCTQTADIDSFPTMCAINYIDLYRMSLQAAAQKTLEPADINAADNNYGY